MPCRRPGHAQAPCAEAAPEGPRSALARSGAWPPTAKACSWGADDRERPAAARHPSADLEFGGVQPRPRPRSGNYLRTGTDQGPRCRPDGKWGGR